MQQSPQSEIGTIGISKKKSHLPKKQAKNESVSGQNHSKIVRQYLKHFNGEVQINKQRKIFIKYLQVDVSEEKYLLKVLNQRIHLKHPNLITVTHFYISNQKETTDDRNWLEKVSICRLKMKIYALEFKPALFTVQSLIKQYCQLRKPLQEAQIRRITKETVTCLQYLKQNFTCHGDIKPTTIFLNPKTKQVALLDSFLINNGKTSFQMIMEDPRSQSFLSPQQLLKSKNRQQQSLKYIHESQVFCVGMTMIEMMTFQASMQAYNLEEMEIKPEFLERKLNQMQEYGYSFNLADLALKCMHKNRHFRPSFQQIMHIL